MHNHAHSQWNLTRLPQTLKRLDLKDDKKKITKKPSKFPHMKNRQAHSTRTFADMETIHSGLHNKG